MLIIKHKGDRVIMPGLDGTGPLGQGPMTGGGFGRCSGNYDPVVYGGRGAGRGRGYRRYYRQNLYKNAAADTAAGSQSDIEARTLELEDRLEALSAENERLTKENSRLKEKKAKE